jgi:hypothetical protein
MALRDVLESPSLHQQEGVYDAFTKRLPDAIGDGVASGVDKLPIAVK